MTPHIPRGPEDRASRPTSARAGNAARSRRRRSTVSLAFLPAVALAVIAGSPDAEAEIVFTSNPPLEAQVGVPYSYTMTARVDNEGGGGGDGGGDDDDDDDDDDDGNSGNGGGGNGGGNEGTGGGNVVIAFAPQLVPRWLAFDGTATISGTPSSEDVGNHPVVIFATGNGELAIQRFSIRVPAPPIPNAPPVFKGAPAHSVNEGGTVDIDVSGYFEDADGDALRFDANGLAGWLALSGSRITGTAPSDAGGTTVSFVVRATDPDGASAEGTLSIAIVAVNLPPQLRRAIEPDPQQSFVGESYAFEVGGFFTDPDNDALTFTATGLPSSLAISAGGRISGTPSAADTASSPFSVTVRAADPSGASISDSFALVVAARNRAPVLDGALAPDPQSVTAGQAYRFDAGAFFSDPDGDTLAFSATGLPPTLSIDSASGVIAGTPTDADGGTRSIRVTASDGAASVSDQYTLTVVVPDEPPVLPDPPPPLGTPEDTPLEITPALLGARDEDVSSLTVVLAPPSGDAHFTLSGGRTVVPERDFNGTLTLRASVKDAQASSNSVTVTITVTPVNDAPRIGAVPTQAASEGTPFELALAGFVSDPEGDALSFSAAGLPPGLSIDAATGTIAGIPAIRAAAGAHAVTFTVGDGDASSSGRFDLRVTEAGRADLAVSAAVAPNPALAGSPATFTFTVTNGASIDVGSASLEVSFTADAPFAIDSVADPACALEPGSGTFVLRCTITPLLSGGSRSIDATARADQAAEIGAAASVAIADAVPIDEMPDNDAAAATLVVARSLGSGPAQEISAPGVRALTVGDFDGNGAEDLAAATGPAQPLVVFLSRSSPDDAARVVLDPAPIAVSAPLDAVDIAAADLDADGDLDLVAADTGGAHRLLVNDGAAGFTSVPLAGGADSEAVDIGDVDGDSLPDIAFAGRGKGANVVLRNEGGGRFTPMSAALTDPAIDVLATDVLGGGPLELVFARADGKVTIASAAAARVQAFDVDTGPSTSLASVDFDGDGRSDLVVGRASGTDAVFLNTSAATPSLFLAAELSRAPTVAVLGGDFDIDGRADVVAIHAAGGHRLYRNSTAANLAFVLNAEQFSSVGAAAAAAGDLNGDGRLDVAVAGGDAVTVFLNDGRGNLGRGDQAAPTLTLLGQPTVTVTVGESYVDAGATASDDVDGDVTERIVVDNPVDVDVIGTYTVSYDVTDLSGNHAQTLTRAVEVRAREAGGGGGGGAAGILGLVALCTALGARRVRERTRSDSAGTAHPCSNP